MGSLSEQLRHCQKKEERYSVVIDYMQQAGIHFRTASADHLKNHYRIMENGSSIFVYNSYYKLNVCDADKKRLDIVPELKFEILYKNKAQGVQDTVRPFTCDINDDTVLERVIAILSGGEKESSENDINVAIPPITVFENDEGQTKVICPNCSMEFFKAPRCPECGQLILYNKERWNKPKLANLDEWERVSDIHGVQAKVIGAFVRTVVSHEGFSYHTGAVDLSIDLNLPEIKKSLQLLMLFGKGPCGAFQPRTMIEFCEENGCAREIAEWFMEQMRPFLSVKQKNTPYERENGYFFVDYSLMADKHDELIRIFLELQNRLDKNR